MRVPFEAGTAAGAASIATIISDLISGITALERHACSSPAFGSSSELIIPRQCLLPARQRCCRSRCCGLTQSPCWGCATRMIEAEPPLNRTTSWRPICRRPNSFASSEACRVLSPLPRLHILPLAMLMMLLSLLPCSLPRGQAADAA